MKLALIGDSWGYGAWQINQQGHEQPGTLTWQDVFAENGLLLQNFSFNNYRPPRVSHDSYWETIAENKSALMDCDRIFVLQTDPLRDVMPEVGLSKEERYNETRILDNLRRMGCPRVDNWQQLTEFLLTRFYHRLVEEKDLNHKFVLIGGLSKVQVNLVPKGLLYWPKSMMEILVPDYDDTPFAFIHNLYFIGETVSRAWNWPREQTMLDLEAIDRHIGRKSSNWRGVNPLFSDCHLTESGVRRIAQLMIDYIKEE